jgi:hypothetical protein
MMKNSFVTGQMNPVIRYAASKIMQTFFNSGSQMTVEDMTVIGERDMNIDSLIIKRAYQSG